MKKVSKTTVKEGRVRWHGKRVIETFVRGKDFTKEDIKQVANKISKDYAKKIDGQLLVTVKYSTGYLPGTWPDLGAPAIVPDYDYYDKAGVVYEQELFQEFVLYVMYKGKRAGGCGQHNDCLFYCIQKFRNGPEYMPEHLREPERLKSFLGLGREDPIPLEKLETV